jgi:hypothetical protein
MCRARFIGGRPVTDALVTISENWTSQQKSRQKKSSPPLTFILDTGADATLINPIDAIKLGLQYHPNRKGVNIPYLNNKPLKMGAFFGGVSGERLKGFELPNTVLTFITDLGNNKHEFHNEQLDILYIAEGNVGLSYNLLGRDILSRFDIILKFSENFIDLTRVYTPGVWSVSVI